MDAHNDLISSSHGATISINLKATVVLLWLFFPNGGHISYHRKIHGTAPIRFYVTDALTEVCSLAILRHCKSGSKFENIFAEKFAESLEKI